MKTAVLAAIGMAMVAPVHAGHSTGKVGQVLVGRLGEQVFVELQSTYFADWPCSSTAPEGFRYGLLLSWPGAREMLATILAAQASGKDLQIVGSGACTIDSRMENISYVVLRP